MKNRVRDLRLKRGWSQAELAERLGVSRQTVIAIEKSRSKRSSPLGRTKMRREPRSLDLTALVLLAALAVAYLKGLEAAVWTLVWVWAGLMALLALVVGVLATFQTERAEIRFGASGVWGRFFLALWALLTALAFASLALKGHSLFWLPVLSLAVVALPDTGRLILDEFVQSLLTGAPGLDVALAALAVYAMGLEGYVALRLRK